jgi:hypothetical protein
MTTLEIQQGITTDERCQECGQEFILIADDAPESIRLTCGCGSVSALN